MADEPEKSKLLNAGHQKIVDDTQKIIDASKEHLSVLKKSIKYHQDFIKQQSKDPEEILEHLEKLKD